MAQPLQASLSKACLPDKFLQGSASVGYLQLSGTASLTSESLVHAGFQEGLSLTVHDEILRYCKYAYGCSEMMFNSMWEWPRKGVLSKLFITYIRLNSIPWCLTPHNVPLFPQIWWCKCVPSHLLSECRGNAHK
jgi:hypothetical protein